MFGSYDQRFIAERSPIRHFVYAIHPANESSEMEADARTASKAPPGSAEQDIRVGVTIITGFLGSGKSTLIRRVLTEQHGLRLVVIENEFSASGTVEEAIVTQGVGPDALEQFIELPNGCICCAAQDDLTDALSRLLRSRPGQVDHILVEASGLADPGPVAASFWVDDELETGLVLDAVVAVADAVNVENYLVDGEGRSEKARITQKQLAVADLVLLNKVDLVDKPADTAQLEKGDGIHSEPIAKLESLLREAGCSAPIIPTTMCNLDLSKLLNIRAYDHKTSERLLATQAPQKFLQHVHGANITVGTVTVSFEGVAFDLSLLDRVLGELLWDNGETVKHHAANASPSREIWRMKALVVVKEEELKWIYQSVDTLFENSASSVKSEDGSSSFIFIGRGLHSEELRLDLDRATKDKRLIAEVP